MYSMRWNTSTVIIIPKRGGSKSSAQTLNKAKYVFEFYRFFLVTRGYFQPHGEGEAWSPDKAADKDSSVAKQFWPGMSPGKGSYFGIFRKFQGNLYKFGRTAQNCVCRQSGLNLCVCSCFCLQSIYFCPPCSWFTLCSKAKKDQISLTISTGLPVMVITNLADL